jgi:hypothetical protein
MPVEAFPTTFYGTIQHSGHPGPANVQVTGQVDNQAIAQTKSFAFNGESVYVLDVPADDQETEMIEGGRTGQSISFQVAGRTVGQTGIWQPGIAEEVNLIVTSLEYPLYFPIIGR